MEKQTKKLIYEYLSKNKILNINSVKRYLGDENISIYDAIEKIISSSDSNDTVMEYLDAISIFDFILYDKFYENIGISSDMTSFKLTKILNEHIEKYINGSIFVKRLLDYIYSNNLLEIKKISKRLFGGKEPEYDEMCEKFITLYYNKDIEKFISYMIMDGWIAFEKSKALYGNDVSETIDTLTTKIISVIVPKVIENKPKEKNNENPLDYQIAGDHYSKQKIQPIEYILANNLGFCEGNVVKYVTRYSSKNGMEDLKKAKHYIEFLIKKEEEKNKN